MSDDIRVPREAIELLERAEEFCVEVFKGDQFAQNNAAVLRNRIDVYLQHVRNASLLAAPPGIIDPFGELVSDPYSAENFKLDIPPTIGR